MFCLAVTILLRRTDNQSALVSLTIVYEGAKAKAAARTYKIQVGWDGGNWKSELFAFQTKLFLDFPVWTLLSSQFYIQRES